MGVSEQRISMEMAAAVMMMNGTMKETLHATWGVRPREWTRESKIAGITKYC